MSKKNRRENSVAVNDKSAERANTYTVALKPRRTLLVIAAVVFALWTALLIFLYFTTVYPARK
jgi:hypothetical protein